LQKAILERLIFDTLYQ